MASNFVPADFLVPTGLVGAGFSLQPLEPEHNVRDYAAWTSSADHIHATPGFERWTWPRPMTLEENLGDLQRHAEDFAQRQGFTYTVIEGADVIGCVYIYPSDDPAFDADVRSWVRADRASLDAAVYELVGQWLADVWPFRTVDYAPR
jgi:hypothetical protein